MRSTPLAKAAVCRTVVRKAPHVFGMLKRKITRGGSAPRALQLATKKALEEACNAQHTVTPNALEAGAAA